MLKNKETITFGSIYILYFSEIKLIHQCWMYNGKGHKLQHVMFPTKCISHNSRGAKLPAAGPCQS